MGKGARNIRKKKGGGRKRERGTPFSQEEPELVEMERIQFEERKGLG